MAEVDRDEPCKAEGRKLSAGAQLKNAGYREYSFVGASDFTRVTKRDTGIKFPFEFPLARVHIRAFFGSGEVLGKEASGGQTLRADPSNRGST